jgi:hypothetical protein
MTNTNTITLTTEEGHDVQLEPRDLAVLQAWPRLDMSRLVVVGDAAVHARRLDGTVHPQSLEDLLALVHVPVAPVKPPAPPVPAMPIPANVRPGGLLDTFLKTGNAKPSRRGMAGAASGGRLPTVLVAGKPVLLKGSTIEAGRVKVPVTSQDSRDVVAWAYVPLADFETLRQFQSRPDILAWRMGSDGRPTTRIKRSPTDTYPQAVGDLLAELGLSPAGLVVEPLEPLAV